MPMPDSCFIKMKVFERVDQRIATNTGQCCPVNMDIMSAVKQTSAGWRGRRAFMDIHK